MSLGILIVGHNILQTVGLIAEDSQMPIDADTVQIIVLHLHANSAYLTDGHDSLDRLEADTGDMYPRLLSTAGDNEIASLIAHTTSYVCGIEWVKQRDISISNGLALTVNKSSH